MFNVKKQGIGALLALSVLGINLPAHADTASDASHQASPAMMAKHADKMAQQQQALHDTLQLSAAQEAAWSTYIAGSKPPPMPAHADQHTALTAPQRLEHMASMSQARATYLNSRSDALKSFYAVLTPAQQKTMDAEYKQMAHRWMHGQHDAPKKG